MDQSLLDTVLRWLTTLGYTHKNKIEKWLFSHPDYPSLKSISDTLNHYGIDSISAKVDVETILTLEQPFLAYINDGVRMYAVMAEVADKNNILISYAHQKSEKISLEFFKSIYQGIILAIDKNTQKAPLSKKITHQKQAILSVFLIISILATWYFTTTPSLQRTLLVLLSLAGVTFTTLINIKAMGYGAPWLDKFCQAGKHSNCVTILNSKGAKVLGLFSLGDLGFVYFFSIVAYLLSNGKLITISGLSLLSLTFIPYSIFYQWQVAKAWCRLCLLVLLVQVLLAVAATATFSINSFDAITTETLVLFVVCSCITTTLWALVKPIIQKLDALQKKDNALLRFSRNYHLFMPYYAQNNDFITDHSQIQGAIYGQAKQNTEILFISNPMCDQCIKTHKMLEDMQKQYTGFNLKTFYFVPIEDRKDPRTFIAERLLEISDKTPHKANEALHNWLNKSKAKEWVDKWGVASGDKYHALISEHRKWCFINNIQSTPTMFINGVRFPNWYSTLDLQHFLPYIIKYNDTVKKGINSFT